MPRRLHTWKIRSRELALGERTLIMGVLNVTPDSFSDGGKFSDPDLAFAHALEMEELGADIIDIGAESTRPGSQPISAAEELRRLVPVLKRLREKLTIPISVDTYKAEVAERALELGVDIINDPSGFTLDPLLSKPIVQYNAGVIFNHMRGRPETWSTLGPLKDVMGVIVKDLDASVSRARRSGVDRLRIVIDPGIGFGKRREQNSEIIARLGEMARLELPILVGPSRKSFLAQPNERETEFATAAAVAASVLGGAHIVRVHDIAAMKAVVNVADEIGRATQRLEEARELAESEAPARRGRVSMATPQIQATAQRPPVRPPLGARFVRREPVREVFEPPVEEHEPLLDEQPLEQDVVEHAVSEQSSVEEPAADHISAASEQPAKPPSKSIRERSQERAGDRPEARPEQSRPPRSFDRGDRPSRPYNRDSDSRPSRPFERSDRPSKPPFGSRPPRPSDRDDRGSRPAYAKPRSDDRSNDRGNARGDRTSRPPFGSRPGSGSRPASSRPSGSRPPGSFNRGGDRPSRPPYNSRPRSDDRGNAGGNARGNAGGDRPSRPPFGSKPRQDDRSDRPSRPPFASRPPRPDDRGDRPPRPPFGSKPPGSYPPRGDRPSRPPFGSRPPSGSRPPRPSDRGDRPPRPAGDGPRSPRPFRPKGPPGKGGPPRDYKPRPRRDD